LILSAVIEEEQQVEIPFDEIGFISMFLSINLGERERIKENNVEVVVLMHGRQTASSMLELAQELLGTTNGTAFNMPLTLDVQNMYKDVIGFIKENKEQLNNGVLFLTDMGSLNTFSHLIFEETGIRTQVIPMASSMVVIEAVRLASAGRSLEDIYQAVRMSFESIVKDQLKLHTKPVEVRKKAVIVTCFTGEGVAAKLYQRITPVINEKKVELIQMQFLEREAFKRHIDALLEEYEIKAIAGTVDVDYQNIPFFSAYDIFDDEKLNTLKRIADDEIPLEKIVYSLKDSLTAIPSIEELIHSLQKIVQQIQTDHFDHCRTGCRCRES
jgi:transcriptional regulatory protein LevR